jgi:cytochrome c556
MRKHLLLALTGVVIVLAAGCAQQPAPTAQQAPQPEYRLTATIKDIMDSIVDPNADYIWESVETIVSARGVEEKRPRTDEDWKEVRRHAIALLEATNLLQMPGRKVAQAGEKADDANVELGPEQIQELINKDHAAWNKFAGGLHDATMDVLKTIEAKDADALLNTSDRIDTACENCHLEYWYPSEKKPDQAPSQKGAN